MMSGSKSLSESPSWMYRVPSEILSLVAVECTEFVESQDMYLAGVINCFNFRLYRIISLHGVCSYLFSSIGAAVNFEVSKY